METRRRFWAALVLAVPLEQLGHALASLIHAGTALEPGRAHGYFAATLETSATIAGAALLAGLLPVALARRVGGRMPRGGAWPFLLLFTGLAAIQLELYLAQEVAEGGRSIDIAVRGLEGQLPVALAGAGILHWLSARIGPALALLAMPSLTTSALPVPASPRPERNPLCLVGARILATDARGPPTHLPNR